jgi:hypothetical protein
LLLVLELLLELLLEGVLTLAKQKGLVVGVDVVLLCL